HRLDRSELIGATPDTVFRFLTDKPRWAAWWGPGSTIDARPGGAVLMRYPGGTETSGAVVEVKPPDRIVQTYEYASGTPLQPRSGSCPAFGGRGVAEFASVRGRWSSIGSVAGTAALSAPAGSTSSCSIRQAESNR